MQDIYKQRNQEEITDKIYSRSVGEESLSGLKKRFYLSLKKKKKKKNVKINTGEAIFGHIFKFK